MALGGDPDTTSIDNGQTAATTSPAFIDATPLTAPGIVMTLTADHPDDICADDPVDPGDDCARSTAQAANRSASRSLRLPGPC